MRTWQRLCFVALRLALDATTGYTIHGGEDTSINSSCGQSVEDDRCWREGGDSQEDAGGGEHEAQQLAGAWRRSNAGMICREPAPRTGQAPKSPVLTFLICPRCRLGTATEVRLNSHDSHLNDRSLACNMAATYRFMVPAGLESRGPFGQPTN